MPVQLRYQGPVDADVAVAGSWDGWTARVPLAYIGGGVHARLLNLEPGTHHYKYAMMLLCLVVACFSLIECGVTIMRQPYYDALNGIRF